jgi:hypothetical protein
MYFLMRGERPMSPLRGRSLKEREIRHNIPPLKLVTKPGNQPCGPLTLPPRGTKQP